MPIYEWFDLRCFRKKVSKILAKRQFQLANGPGEAVNDTRDGGTGTVAGQGETSFGRRR